MLFDTLLEMNDTKFQRELYIFFRWGEVLLDVIELKYWRGISCMDTDNYKTV